MIDADGNVQFYAHIDGANSDTVDAKITGGSLRILDGVGATGIRGSRTADIAADIAHAF
jgi:tRNA G26 N,N-dimethylase Trm1